MRRRQQVQASFTAVEWSVRVVASDLRRLINCNKAYPCSLLQTDRPPYADFSQKPTWKPFIDITGKSLSPTRKEPLLAVIFREIMATSNLFYNGVTNDQFSVCAFTGAKQIQRWRLSFFRPNYGSVQVIHNLTKS